MSQAAVDPRKQAVVQLANGGGHPLQRIEHVNLGAGAGLKTLATRERGLLGRLQRCLVRFDLVYALGGTVKIFICGYIGLGLFEMRSQGWPRAVLTRASRSSFSSPAAAARRRRLRMNS